ARRQADRVAALRRIGADRRRVDDESRRHEPAADHRLRVDELGAVHAPVGSVHHLRVEQTRLRELRAVHRRPRRQEGAGARHLLRRLRRAARAVTRRQAARVDIDAVGRRPGPDFPRAVESREGARSLEGRAAEKAEQEVMRTYTLRISTGALVIACSALSAVADGQDTKAYVRTLASERFEGRLAGSNGERLAADFLVGELQKIGAKPLPGQADFREPFEFTAGTKDGGSGLSIRYAAQGGVESGVTNSGVGIRALSFSDNGDVT